MNSLKKQFITSNSLEFPQIYNNKKSPFLVLLKWARFTQTIKKTKEIKSKEEKFLQSKKLFNQKLNFLI